MFIIVDERMPVAAMRRLAEYGTVIEFPVHEHVFSPISAHPDVFITQLGHELVVAPNVNTAFVELLNEKKIQSTFGLRQIGSEHPDTTGYNVVITDTHIIQNPKYTDSSVLERCANKISIDVKQAYARCSAIHVGRNRFITSDMSIYTALSDAAMDVLLVKTDSIQLLGLKYGLFGGCCGFYENTLFICGSLNNYADSEKVRIFTQERGISIVELYEGALVDVGGLFFVNNS